MLDLDFYEHLLLLRRLLLRWHRLDHFGSSSRAHCCRPEPTQLLPCGLIHANVDGTLAQQIFTTNMAALLFVYSRTIVQVYVFLFNLIKLNSANVSFGKLN